jgi:hypothetical protein
MTEREIEERLHYFFNGSNVSLRDSLDVHFEAGGEVEQLSEQIGCTSDELLAYLLARFPETVTEEKAEA